MEKKRSMRMRETENEMEIKREGGANLLRNSLFDFFCFRKTKKERKKEEVEIRGRKRSK